VGSRREISPQTQAVLAALCAQPTAWQHGYALARDTGLKSGTLYPILIRLADRGLVEACWQEEPTPGRPRRHLYRLTPDGLASAAAAIAGTEPAGAVLAGAKPAGTEGRPGTRPRRGHGVAAPAVP
jgi:PadR family transcriptional regulator, regulatory protein PadR